jgi:hypothetical protein
MRRRGVTSIAIVLASGAAACSALLDFDLSGSIAGDDAGDERALDSESGGGDGSLPDGHVDGAPIGSQDAADERDPARGPILRYDFEAIDGAIVVDTSDSGNYGTILQGNDGGRRIAGRTGGTGIQLADVNDRVDCARLTQMPAEGTLLFWARDEETDADSPGSTGLFSNRNTTSSRLIVWRQDGQPVRRFQVGFENASDAGATQFAATYDFDVDKDWTLIAVIWSSTTGLARIIVKRPLAQMTLVKDLSIAGWNPGPQSCFFGQNWHGTVDDVTIFDRALTDTEILALP